MIPIEHFVDDAVRTAKRMKEGACLDVRTYKKDRGVLIERKGECYNVYEDGFENQSFMGLTLQETEKVLYKIRKREFPRSRFAHFYKYDRIEEIRHERRH